MDVKRTLATLAAAAVIGSGMAVTAPAANAWPSSPYRDSAGNSDKGPAGCKTIAGCRVGASGSIRR